MKHVCSECSRPADKLIRTVCNKCYQRHYHAKTLDKLPLPQPRERKFIERSEKFCPRCSEIKPIDTFNKATDRVDGRMGWCRSCYSDQRQQKGEYWRNYELQRKYGLTQAEYDVLLDKQGGACAICLQKLTSRLHVDHCHNSKAVRGLLCTSCNNGLGRFKDNPELLEAAAAYLRR